MGVGGILSDTLAGPNAMTSCNKEHTNTFGWDRHDRDYRSGMMDSSKCVNEGCEK